MTNTTRTIGSIVSPARPHFDEDSSFDYVNLTTEQRSPFETDGDKIAFSEGFRALADKTQVHDRTGIDGNFRNRLTHSMEVSRVGRSLGVGVGARMIAYYGLHSAPAGEAFWRVDPTDIGHIVGAACMAHDVGNPPFGHEGEDQISSFYANSKIGKTICSNVDPNVANELRLHEGNAQGFRMITRTMGWREGRGLNLTSATLAAFGKYPFSLRPGQKKYGVYHDDMETMERVALNTKMQEDPAGGWKRHPLAYLMEAADDICYLTVDMEDAALMGLISYEELLENFALVLTPSDIAEGRAMSSKSLSIKFLRSKMVKYLINSCVAIYPEIAGSVEEGTLCKSVNGGGFLGHGQYGEAMEKIREFSSRRIYNSSRVRTIRDEYKDVFRKALGGLNVDLMRWMENSGSKELTHRCEEAGLLARIPSALIGAHVPADLTQAVRWLIDEVTLMSDAQLLDLSRSLENRHFDLI